MNSLRIPLLIGAVLLTVCILYGLSYFRAENAGASVTVGNEYQATTTFAGHALEQRVLKTGYGALGSVVITGDNTGFIQLYNATTSNVSARTGNKASSSILIADFPASTPEGTYTFDAEVTDGLLLVTSGAEATSTITYR